MRFADIEVVAFDYGGTISGNQIDHRLGEKPVDPGAAGALRELHRMGKRLVLASNTLPGEPRWPALADAGLDSLFAGAALSYWLGVRKPDPRFYRVVSAIADCSADRMMFVGDRLDYDVAAPLDSGAGAAALVRPGGLRPGELLPDGAVVIGHVRELPTLLARQATP